MTTVRAAAPGDELDVRRVLDAAMLDVRDDLAARIDAGDVLVATEDGRTLGALVLVPLPRAPGAHVDAVAVRRARRGQGIGGALVAAAADRRDRLTAAFDPEVRPFYESLGFEIRPGDDGDGRLRGERETGAESEE